MLRIRLCPKGNKRNKIFTIDVVDSKKHINATPNDRIGYLNKKKDLVYLNVIKYNKYLSHGANINNKKFKKFIKKVIKNKTYHEYDN